MKSTILIIEDDPAISRLLELALKTNGFKPITSMTGLSGISLVLTQKPDLVLLDLGLPDINGFEVLEQIRNISSVPLIVVSARSHEKEKVFSLENGADDYITKPFNIAELVARIKLRIKQSYTVNHETSVFAYKDLIIDYEKYQVKIRGNEVKLSPIEFKILRALSINQGKVLTHAFIQADVWGEESRDDNQSLRVFMTTLRKKIELNTQEPVYIITEIGVGYKMSDE